MIYIVRVGGFKVGKRTKRKKKDESRREIAFEGARVALPIFIDEYSKECDRKEVIENKISTLLTIEIAILTVFIPMVPFGSIKTYLFDNCNSIIIVATIACVLLGMGTVIMSVSFGILMNAIGIKTYNKVNIEELDLEDNLGQDANSVEKGLCDHYKRITIENSNLNDKKADKYQICLPITIVSFLFLTIGTTLLKIL